MRLFLYLIFLSFFYATSARCTEDLPEKHTFAEEWNRKDYKSPLNQKRTNDKIGSEANHDSSISAEKWDWKDDKSPHNHQQSDDTNRTGENHYSSFSSEKSDKEDDISQESNDKKETEESHDSSSSLEKGDNDDVSQQNYQESDDTSKTGEKDDSSENSDSRHSEDNSGSHSDSDSDRDSSSNNANDRSSDSDSDSDSEDDDDSHNESDGTSDSKSSSSESGDDNNSDHTQNDLEKNVSHDSNELQSVKQKEKQDWEQENKQRSTEEDDTRQNTDWKNWYNNPESRKSWIEGIEPNKNEEIENDQWRKSLDFGGNVLWRLRKTDGNIEDDKVKSLNKAWGPQDNSWNTETRNEWEVQNPSHNIWEPNTLLRLKERDGNIQDAKVKGWNEPWELQDNNWNARTADEWEGHNRREKDLWNPSYNNREPNTQDALWRRKKTDGNTQDANVKGWNEPRDLQDKSWNTQKGNEWKGQNERGKDSWNPSHNVRKPNAKDNNWDGFTNDNDSNEPDDLSNWTKPQYQSLHEPTKENERNQPEEITPESIGKLSDKKWKPKKKGKKGKDDKNPKQESFNLDHEKGHPDIKPEVNDYPQKLPGDLKLNSGTPQPWSPNPISDIQDLSNLKTDGSPSYDNKFPDYSTDSKNPEKSQIFEQQPILDPHNTPESSVDRLNDGSLSDEPNANGHNSDKEIDTATVPKTGEDTKNEQPNEKDHTNPIVNAEADLINHYK